MKIAIVGWGVEGQSAYKYFGPDHEYLIVNEQSLSDFPPESDKVKVRYLSSDKPPGVTGNVEDLSYLDGVDECDKILYSVTSRKNLHRKFGDSPEFWAKTTSVMQIFFENVKTKNLIGITGSKGKGTTSTLVYKFLEAAGKKSYLAGNIGLSVLDILDKIQPNDWVVLEMSSFQLYEFNHSPHIAVCLMIIQEHMDWHDNMEEYVRAKSNIFAHQSPEDIAVYFADNQYSAQIAQLSPGQKIPYYQNPGAYVRDDGMIMAPGETEIAHKSEVKLLGEHNLQNICAALTAFWQVAQDVEASKKVIASFSGLEHRLELVRELNGVKYYDDSFSTTPETAIVAMRAINQPKVMILGGSDKGIPFDSLADEVTKNNVKHAIVIGQTASKIIELLKERGFTDVTGGLTKMEDIVNTARAIAVEGDVVLLSCGCASFGLFKDYKDRGNQFKAAVQALG
jgi:UDP-N-acetylmuramoylalanine--D-glutamate ligase